MGWDQVGAVYGWMDSTHYPGFEGICLCELNDDFYCSLQDAESADGLCSQPRCNNSKSMCLMGRAVQIFLL